MLAYKNKILFLLISFFAIDLSSATNPEKLIDPSAKAQAKFEDFTKLLNFRLRTENELATKVRKLESYFFSYQGPSYDRINDDLRAILLEGKDPFNNLDDPRLEHTRLEYAGIFEMLVYILVMPKISSPSFVYRGVPSFRRKGCAQVNPYSECTFSRLEKPGTFLSTTLDYNIAAYKFARQGGDVFVIHLSKGLPFLIVPNYDYEKEVILPPYLLNKKGELAPLELETQGSWNYAQLQHDVYVKNSMGWNPEKESLLNYEKRYAQLVCKQVAHINAHIDTICSKAIQYYEEQCIQSPGKCQR